MPGDWGSAGGNFTPQVWAAWAGVRQPGLDLLELAALAPESPANHPEGALFVPSAEEPPVQHQCPCENTRA